MSISTALIIGATGSMGRLAATEALRQGYRTLALVRTPSRASVLPEGVEPVRGDLTDRESIRAALEGADAVIFAHGAEGSEETIRQVEYNGVRNVLDLIAHREVRIVLTTGVGVTARTSWYNTSHIADWKRRAERLVRSSGQPYTIVRPGWFDENGPNEQQLVLRQDDREYAGGPSDGTVSREQLAQVLVSAVTALEAAGKTFELVAEYGPATIDLNALFDGALADTPRGLDGVGDRADMPLEDEPAEVVEDLRRLSDTGMKKNA